MRRDEEFAVGESSRFEINVASGSVRIANGDPGVARLSIDASDADAVEISQVGDVVSVRQQTRWTLRGRPVHVALWIPLGSDVTVDSASAEIHLRGTFNAVRLRSASGDLDVDRVARLEAGTASGAVRLVECTGSAVINSASGDVVLGRVGGELGGTHASGDVQVEEVGGSIDVGTVSGDVTIRRCFGDDIAIKTVSGDVRIGLPAGVRVHPEITTLSGRTTLPSPAGSPAGSSTGSPVDAGSRREVRLRLRTVSGNIRIDRVS